MRHDKPGTNAIPAVPLVTSWLTNRDPVLVGRAASVLGWWQVEPELVVPALAACCLASPGSAGRLEAVMALGKFGQQAKPALPSLFEALNDSDAFVRAQATNAIWKVAPELLTLLTNGVTN